MTVAAVPTRPSRPAGLRPVPWWRMAWVTWRQHRLMLAGVAAFLGVLAVYLVIEALPIRRAYAAMIACHPASSAACQQLANDFDTGGSVFRAGIVTALLQVVPGLIGAFAGAPVLARELETGTFRYAWTQGFGRWRWTLAKLVPLAVVVAAAAAAFSAVFSWYYHPFLAAATQSPLGPTVFDLRGVAFAAWTLAAVAIGALAGLLIRRVVPAMAASLAAWGGLAAAAGLFLRQRYATPLITSDPNVGAPAWVIVQWWTRGGRPVSLSTVNQALRKVDVTEVRPGLYHSYGSGLGNAGSPTQYLIQHGYTQLTTYDPASRFWPFQWIEGGWLLALSLLLIAATVWLVRRRAA
jgi:hypothetical protein